MAEAIRKVSIELSGITLNPGIAIGRAYRFKQIDLESLKNNFFPIKDINLELSRLQRSIDKSKEQLSSLQKAGIDTGKKDIADIFAAHIQLLQDTTFLQSIRDAVKIERLNVEHILSVKIGDIEQRFRSIENETVRTRLVDIQDVYYRLLRNLLEIEHVRIAPLLRARLNPILVAEHLLPSDIALLEFRNIAGLIIEEASAVSHVAIIAQSFSIPTIINVPGVTSIVHSDNTIIIDGFSGKVIINPTLPETASYKLKKNGTSKKNQVRKYHHYLTRDGIRIRLEANANTPQEIESAIENGAEGIGLVRSEFFYLGRSKYPDPQEELNFYREIHKSAAGRPVTIRLLDLGADKSLPFINVPAETNPQLGLRGIRYLFANPDLLDRHFRSVLKSSKYGPVRIMVPFVSIIQELDYLYEIMERIISEERINRSGISMGIMVEIPSVVWSLPQFMDKVDFLSIGTNDLTQFTFAADRENRKLEEFRRASLPVLLKMIKSVAQAALIYNKDVSVCGEIASDPATASLLIGAGIRILSARVNALDAIKKEIESKSMDQAQVAVGKYLEMINGNHSQYRRSA
ncbi:MAG: phosphoenolpyruvate--protein phosphotransferase [Fibrobacter sp.]|nr:phosphoenolpyruvate--protein phosphotransferase [Fibrobacter sp.]